MLKLPLLIAALVLGSHTASAGTLDRIRESGTFRIGYRADARPYSYQDRNGQPAGYIIDLCTEVAALREPV
ncbi:MAG: transporter substrate-binding domain-containing protein [Alphaproteobacteria bacterium]|nr:transporter substrate-binding domain-containing protein [Alphaproteobacteria bacterium]